MNDLNVGAIVSAVQKNCHISDAQFASDLTLCTFLLKMRELYRWEHDIPLTQMWVRPIPTRAFRLAAWFAEIFRPVPSPEKLCFWEIPTRQAMTSMKRPCATPKKTCALRGPWR